MGNENSKWTILKSVREGNKALERDQKEIEKNSLQPFKLSKRQKHARILWIIRSSIGNCTLIEIARIGKTSPGMIKRLMQDTEDRLGYGPKIWRNGKPTDVLMTKESFKERNEKILKAWESGKTLTEICNKFKFRNESSVQQILKRFGVSFSESTRYRRITCKEPL